MSHLLIPEILLIALAIPLGVGLLAFWVWMLVDCLKSERVSGQDRLVWAIVIVVLKPLGAVIYYFMEYRSRPTVGTPVSTGG